jgi:RNA-binding protein PNO1
MNIKSKAVELRTSKFTTEGGSALQKGADFVRAFALGFDVDDAIALLRLDDLYIESTGFSNPVAATYGPLTDGYRLRH